MKTAHMVVARIDYQKSDKHSIFGRYLGEHVVDPAPYDLNHNLLSSAGNSTPRIDGFAQAFTVGSTYLFSANIVNAFRLTGNRIAAGKFEPDRPQGGRPRTGRSRNQGIQLHVVLPPGECYRRLHHEPYRRLREGCNLCGGTMTSVSCAETIKCPLVEALRCGG